MSKGRRLYEKGKVASAGMSKLERVDVLVEGERIVEVGTGLSPGDGGTRIDCKGRILLPGLFDVHTHIRGVGEDTLIKAANAGVKGGYTGLTIMPDAGPHLDEGSLISSLREKARACAIDLQVAGCVTKGGEGKALAGIAGMKNAGAVFLTDGDVAMENPRLLRRAMEYARNFDLLIASHCDTPALSEGGVMNEGVTSYQLGLPSMPALSEEIAVERDLRMARFVDARIHLRGVTTGESVRMIRQAKEENVKVTAEVCPHHLLFAETDIGDYDTNFKVNPPLRTEADREALLQGVRDEVIDLIASDHSPRSSFEKLTDFQSAPFGMSWLETALVALHHHLVKPGAMSWGDLVRSCCLAPRGLAGKEGGALAAGESADFVIFHPEGRTRFLEEGLENNHSNTPFLNQELDGKVEKVVFLGEEILNQ